MNRTARLFIDVQTGVHFYARTVAELRRQIGNGGSRVRLMYADADDGNTYRIGYVIGGHWLEMYEPVRRKVVC